ncbi:FXSXX-COOH protein [Streptomyces ipomoeae]|uniref:FXSXX-COOH protein n=2 Tax=Streptomyces ipomoeae TaxID=103232 RepID=A0AAE8W239_9ACTN|nr:FXSXX-COOH protein [Streptomyces ipomoeae]TQE31637.1 FXSXX-COOH protein [Streptomyces ipomoeae]
MAPPRHPPPCLAAPASHVVKEFRKACRPRPHCPSPPSGSCPQGTDGRAGPSRPDGETRQPMNNLLVPKPPRTAHSTPSAPKGLDRLTAINTSAPGTLRSIARVTDVPGRLDRSAEFNSTI